MKKLVLFSTSYPSFALSELHHSKIISLCSKQAFMTTNDYYPWVATLNLSLLVSGTVDHVLAGKWNTQPWAKLNGRTSYRKLPSTHSCLRLSTNAISLLLGWFMLPNGNIFFWAQVILMDNCLHVHWYLCLCFAHHSFAQFHHNIDNLC
jgi:hypothetical protein